MAYPIPKLQYKNASVTGNTTSASAVVNAIATTADLTVGALFIGSGIPAGTTILSIDSDVQVTLSANATATASGVSFESYFEIEFDYPPIETSGGKTDAKETISVSISGVRQVSVGFLEYIRKLKFKMLPDALKTKVVTFVRMSGALGETFRYFEDKAVPSYEEYELNTLSIEPKIVAPKGNNTYSWEIDLDFRQVL